MPKFKKIIPLIVLIVAIIGVSVFAKSNLSHAHVDILPESSVPHVILMTILLVTIAVSIMLSWNCAIFFRGRTGSGFEYIAIGLGILSIVEALNIFNHLGWVISESTIDHFVKIVAFIIIGVGFQSIITAKVRKGAGS